MLLTLIIIFFMAIFLSAKPNNMRSIREDEAIGDFEGSSKRGFLNTNENGKF